MSEPFDLYYDPLCPYVYRAALWMERLAQSGIELTLRWRPFSLAQVNNRREGWEVWHRPIESPGEWLDRRTRGLNGQWATLAAARQGPDAERRFLGALLRLIHEEGAALDAPETTARAAARADLDLDQWELDRRDPVLLDRVRDSHQEAVALGIFGTPTYHFAGAAPLYVKLADIPLPARAPLEWARFVRLATESPLLLELKRPH